MFTCAASTCLRDVFPACGVPISNYLARWTRYVVFIVRRDVVALSYRTIWKSYKKKNKNKKVRKSNSWSVFMEVLVAGEETLKEILISADVSVVFSASLLFTVDE